MQIHTILDLIDLGSIALPEFQRGYVWNRDQVRSLMDSLYRKHPVGSLLVWATRTESAKARGNTELQPGVVKLLLDGQQRITSLYGVIRGAPPRFFQGHSDAFTGLYFNLREETFEFYSPLKMKDNPAWISVTQLMQEGVGGFVQRLVTQPDLQPDLSLFINRLNAIEAVKSIELHVEEVAGEDKTVDVVVDIFNRVNSGGTKLSKGDLALARVCAGWPEARDEMKSRLTKWRRAGFEFRLEWLLRCINTIVTGEALFSALADVGTSDFQRGLTTAESAIDRLLSMVGSRLGLDHDRVLGSQYAFPVMARYLTQRGGTITDYRDRDRLLFWYIHTLLWGRYAGSTESYLNQDLALIEETEGALDRLIDQLRQYRPDLRLQPNDFRVWSRGARFYPLLYMLTRVCHARDLVSGVELSDYLLGRLSRLEVHHIFPKALLYKHGYARSDVNAIANFTFLTQESNLLVSDAHPEHYLADAAAKQPGALESNWIPNEPGLWKIERYQEFLEVRRELLARAANDFLSGLLGGSVPEADVAPDLLSRERRRVSGGISDEDEERRIYECSEWVAAQGLPEGEIMFELLSPEGGEPLAILDLAWPDGMQESYSQPVALMIDEDVATMESASQAGYRCFSCVEELKRYVEREVLAVAPDPRSA
ncbi:MAG TPA: DUF262 domain-containing protein [Armatimonadota bacterium]|jgi:hypothetical protein